MQAHLACAPVNSTFRDRGVAVAYANRGRFLISTVALGMATSFVRTLLANH
jgi:hypothetical protein